MVVPSRLAVLGLTLLAALAIAAPAQAAKRTVPAGFFGVSWDGAAAHASAETQDLQWSVMARFGVESVRTVFSWARAQPTPAGGIDFSHTDALVARAAERRLRLLPVVLETPGWAQRFKGHELSPPRVGSEYGKYLAALVRRYGSRGSFWTTHPELPRVPVRAWQIWNEPHLSYRWYAPKRSSAAWPKGYARLLKSAYRSIKRANPRAQVVAAGLTNDSWNRLDELYRAHGGKYFDVAAIQSYTSNARRALRAVRLFRRSMRRHGDARKSLRVTETSWPAAQGRLAARDDQRTLITTDRGMARRLKTFLGSLARLRRKRSYRVAAVYWYTWSSAYRDTKDIFDFAGLQRYRGGVFSPQPALRYFRAVARRYEGCAKDGDGTCLP